MQASRFDTTFKNYEVSPVHRDSPTLAKTAGFVSKLNRNDLHICDVGCGAGHFSLKLADYAESITFIDPSEKMLSMLKDKTTELQKSMQLSFLQSPAERIQLPSDHFDIVLSRLAAHHFSDIQQSVWEMFRILKPGGYLIINDLVGSENEELDKINHTLEVLHDPTHGRSYKRSDWERFISNTIGKIETSRISLESPPGITIDFWCSITKVNEDCSREIKNILHTLSDQEKTELGYSESGGELLNHVKTVYLQVKK